jgi:hypothetical protein
VSLLGRLHRIAVDFGSALQAPFGYVKDLAVAPWRDDEDLDGFFHTVFGRAVNRFGQFVTGAAGGIGTAAQPVAVPAARGVARGVSAVLGGLETAYREGVSEPLATTMLVAARNPGIGDIGKLFSPAEYREAHRLVERAGVSPGEAIAAAVTTAEPVDEQRLAELEGSTAFHLASGLADAVFRLFLDPTVVGGKFVKIAREIPAAKVAAAESNPILGWIVRSRAGEAFFRAPVASAADIDAALSSRRAERFFAAVDTEIARAGGDADVAAARLRHRFSFLNPSAASLLAEVPPEERRRVMAAAMGDTSAYKVLLDARPELAAKVSRVTEDLRALDEGVGRGLHLPADAVEERRRMLTAELESAENALRLADRVEAVSVAAATRAPRASLTSGLRSAAISDGRFAAWYQNGKLSAPLRVSFRMRPHHLVDVNRPDADVQLWRFLEKAGLPMEDRLAWRGRMTAAVDPAERSQILLDAQDAAVRHVAEAAGMTSDDVERLLADAARRRGRAMETIRARAYDAEGRSRIRFTEDGEWYERPLMVSQEANVVPMVDIEAVKGATTGLGRWRMRHPTADIPGDLLDRALKFWKTSVLVFRVGWPIRVVTDEQLRIAAKFGALSTALGHVVDLTRRAAAGAKAIFEEAAPAAEAADGPVARSFRERLAAAAEAAAEAGRGRRPVETALGTAPSAFGTPVDAGDLWERLVSSKASFRRVIGDTPEEIHANLRATGAWRGGIHPSDPDHLVQWSRALNEIARDEVGRRFLEGASISEIERWLRTTPEGLEYWRRMRPVRLRYQSVEDWLENLADHVAAYTAGGRDDVVQAALDGKATPSVLEQLVPRIDDRPYVHGQVVEAIAGRNPLARVLRGFVDTAMEALGRAPTDFLSRNPYFDAVYRAEVTRLADIAAERGVRATPEVMERLARSAREHALKEVRSLLYDLAEESELGHLLRHVIPFYMPWQEVLTRWAGLAVENPAFVARMRQAWLAPQRAGILHTDDRGQDWIRIPVPEWARRLPGLSGLAAAGTVDLNPRSFNLVTQGLPSVGPVVSIPVNEVAKARPDLESALRWALPYGQVSSPLELVEPTIVQRLVGRVRQTDDRDFAAAAARIFLDGVVDYNLGRRAERPTWDEAVAKARKLWNLRIVAAFVSPVQPNFRSPYQPWIEAYQALRRADPATADQRFIQTYGEEFFAATQAITRSVDGVPPSIEGERAYQRYRDLIEAAPELGALIVGSEGAGAFSRSVYEAQFRRGERRRLTPEELAAEPERRLGWLKFSAVMDILEAARVERGLPNFSVRGARDLAALRNAAVALLAQRYPAWADDYFARDERKMARRIEAMRRIVADERLAARPDIAGLRDYLALRDALVGILARRRSRRLDATSNRDLALIFETAVANLRERNPAFADLWNRWLVHDVVEAPMLATTTGEAA